MILFDFLDLLGPVGSAGLTLFFSIPFLFFAWIPGLNTVLAALIFIAGIRIALNKPIWLPKTIGHRKISGDKVAHHLVKWVKFFKKIEKTIHPRGTLYEHSPFLQTFNGFVLSLCGFFLFLTLSPMANFLQGLVVFLLSIAILEEDLFLMLGAYIVLIFKIVLLFLPNAPAVT